MGELADDKRALLLKTRIPAKWLMQDLTGGA
jgi:hypothetical protein